MYMVMDSLEPAGYNDKTATHRPWVVGWYEIDVMGLWRVEREGVGVGCFESYVIWLRRGGRELSDNVEWAVYSDDRECVLDVEVRCGNHGALI